MEIPIFPQEQSDNLYDKIFSNTSVSYSSLAEPCSSDHLRDFNISHTVASLNDYDLYHVQSILVSTIWNRNDDVFDPLETWIARHSPEHKPANLNHDEKEIVGHIISNIPVTVDGGIISDDIDIADLPVKYHILTGSVIYLAYRDEELKARAIELINQIKEGEKYVSMECLFKNFDYALKPINSTDNSYKIIPRNKDSAYLTKFLRVYGGNGEYNGYKIGRLLRQITFSGKGFVDKPANPDSIAFIISETETDPDIDISINKQVAIDDTEVVLEKNPEKIDDLNHLCVSNNQTQNNEMETIMTEQDVIEIKSTLAEIKNISVAEKHMEDEKKKMEEKVKAHEETIAELTTKAAALEAALEVAKSEIENSKQVSEATVSALNTSVAEKDAAIAEKEAAISELNTQIASLNEVVAAYKDKEAEMAKKEKSMKRTASLIENGVTSEVAVTYAEKFGDLDDEMFDSVTSLLASKKTVAESVTESVVEETVVEDSTVANADESILETAEVTEEVNLAVASEVENPIVATREALVNFVSSKLSKK